MCSSILPSFVSDLSACHVLCLWTCGEARLSICLCQLACSQVMRLLVSTLIFLCFTFSVTRLQACCLRDNFCMSQGMNLPWLMLYRAERLRCLLAVWDSIQGWEADKDHTEQQATVHITEGLFQSSTRISWRQPCQETKQLWNRLAWS